jgi:vitamin B12 transporter
MARRLAALTLGVLYSLVSPVFAQPGNTFTLNGSVNDALGVPLARAIVVAVSGDTATRQTETDSAGAFSLRDLPPGTYNITVSAPLFVSANQTVTVGPGIPLQNARFTLRLASLTETVVVTASRVESKRQETPQAIDVVDRADLERTVAADLTDVLKKNAAVDIIQYSGALSGIGIRGFRPQTSGVNKRSLLLVDGRPSGITNLATLMLDDVERVEVLKGSASSVYGSSAMGGVVNVITRQSRGRIAGAVQAGAGSFGASTFAGRVGGNAMSRVDFDATATMFDQRDDYRMGNGEVRPATRYKTRDEAIRVGFDLTPDWRVNGRIEAYRGRDIMTPGDLASGINSQSKKNLEQSAVDVRLTGRVGAHDISLTSYRTAETSHVSNVTTTNPLDAPYLPYLSFESDLHWNGVQLRDAWRWAVRNALVMGTDYEQVNSVSRSYARTGQRTAPFSADSDKRTLGLYAEHTTRWRDGRTVLALGGRVDRITTATLDTPLKTNFTPSETAFLTFNPSAGITHEIARGVRGHATIGRGFIPAEAIMLTGFTTTTVGGREQVSQGNPDLRPERSVGVDGGVEWTTSRSRVDVTLFRTVVGDRFITNVVISNPPPPAPIVVSVQNGLDAHISGAELDGERQLGDHLSVFANETHFFNRKERLASGAEQDNLNVARTTIRTGADVRFGRFSSRMALRFAHGRKDNNFNAPGFPIIDYDDLTVVDASATYRLAARHALVVMANNLFDAFYYEKLGFPLQGRSFSLSYRIGF